MILVGDIVSNTLSTYVSVVINEKEVQNVWNFFTRTRKDKYDIEKTMRKYCGHNYKVARNLITKNNYETSHLSWHVNVCKSIANLDLDLNLYLEGKFGTQKFNQKIHLKLLVRVIIKHGIFYNFVDHERIRERIKKLVLILT